MFEEIWASVPKYPQHPISLTGGFFLSYSYLVLIATVMGELHSQIPHACCEFDWFFACKVGLVLL